MFHSEASATHTQAQKFSNEQFRACIEACNECADACDYCAASCLREKDLPMMAHCIALDTDCATVCRAASALLSRGGEWAVTLCGICATLCEACATECEKHEHSHCQACARACRECAEECRRLGNAPRHGIERPPHLWA